MKKSERHYRYQEELSHFPHSLGDGSCEALRKKVSTKPCADHWSELCADHEMKKEPVSSVPGRIVTFSTRLERWLLRDLIRKCLPNRAQIEVF